MSNTPKVSIAFANGNLLAAIAGIDGNAALIGTGTATPGIALGEPFVVNSLQELVALGALPTYRAPQAAVPQVNAVGAVSGNLTVAFIINDGEQYTVTVGSTVVGVYTKVPGDTTATAIATAIRAAVNAATGSNGGYTAGGSGQNVTITAPAAAGATVNGRSVTLSYPGGSSSTSLSGGVNFAAAIPAITENDTADLYRHVKEFYEELGGSQPLYIMLLDRSTTMTQMLDSTNPNLANKLIAFGQGRIRTLGLFRKPAAGYNAGTSFIDQDVPTALLASNSFRSYWQDRNFFFSMAIEGRVANENSPVIYSPSSAEALAALVVLGGTKNDGSASVGGLLGRRMKYAGHIKVGKVANGPLVAPAVFIGTKALAAVTNLDTLHGHGYLTYVTYPNKAGFYYGIDRMANTGDYRLLVYRNVVDQAAVIADAVLTNELEGEVLTQANGTIAEEDAIFLEQRVTQQINQTIGDRISEVQVIVDRTVNIINTSRTKIKLRVRPLGYNTFIETEIGLTAGN